MRPTLRLVALAAASSLVLSGCGDGWRDDGGDDGGDGGGSSTPTSYVGTTGVFVAYANPIRQTFDSAPIGSYAGEREIQRGTVDFTTGTDLGQPAGVEIYKGSDGHLYELDLTAFDGPQPQQVSNETQATVDDACSLSGTQAAGESYAYAGVYFAPDLQNPVNSTYFYRVPTSGACGSGSDTVRMVRTGMTASSAPIAVSGMPVETVYSSLKGITGFVVTSGNQLLLVDANFQNPVVLGTFASTIGVAAPLPIGLATGEPTGRLFVVDGNIVYVDYTAHTVSLPLYTIPNWSSTRAAALFAASPTTLYVSSNTAATSTTPASTSVWAIAADGSAAAQAVDTEPGSIETLVFPVGGASVLWGVSNAGSYTIRALPDAGGAATTLATSPVNDGTFIANADAVYYTTWAGASNSGTQVVTRSATSTGIVGMDGGVLQAPLASSTFVDGGELAPWPDATTNATAYETILQVQGLSTVSVTNTTTGITTTSDAVSGGTVVAIDASTHQPVVTLGTVPHGNAVSLGGSFRDTAHNGFLEATNALSTGNPATRGLYVLNARQANSFTSVAGNL